MGAYLVLCRYLVFHNLPLNGFGLHCLSLAESVIALGMQNGGFLSNFYFY